MFENDFLEKFTRIHPATPFVFWIPIAAFVFGRAVYTHVLPLGTAVALIPAGVFVWTIAEYILHRWVFHWTNDTAWGKRIHFLLHGVHHDFPNDKDRLVMPLLTSIPLAIIFYTLFSVTLGHYAAPFFTGFTFGYLWYDGSHYAIHHFKLTSGYGKRLKRHHMLHHHMDHDGGFGVSSKLWDLVLGTLPKVKPPVKFRSSQSSAVGLEKK
jgi:sterol desaturase/sphingolipid hydroxylase (fatty acid hydroxylase superfamily)